MTRGGGHFRLQDDRRRRTAVALAVLGVLGAGVSAAQEMPNQSGRRADFGRGLGRQDLPPGLTFEPRLDAAVQDANNVGLSSSRGESAAGLELAPGAYAAYSSDRFRGAADYSLIGRAWDDGSLDDVSNLLAANGRWVAVPDWMFLSGEASIGEVVIDNSQGGNYGNLGVFNAGNISEQAIASISPMLQHRFREFAVTASYSYGRVWYLDEDRSVPTSAFSRYARSDSIDQSADLRLDLAPDANKFSARVFYTWDRSEFETAVPYEFERLGFEGALELTRTLSLVGDVGKESALDVNSSVGGLDSDFWSAGLRWEPTKRSSAEARYGERFFGSSYYVRIRHAARFLEFAASYSESPNVETYQYNLDAFEPGELPPWFNPNEDLGQFNSQPYVGTNTRASVRAEGRRTTIAVSAFDTERDYLNDFIGDEHSTGVALLAARELAANASVDFQASYYDRERGETTFLPGDPLPASHDYDTELVLRGNYSVSPRVRVSLESGYFNRSGSSAYDGWWVGLRGRWLPAFGR
jgi:hypothetical protein